MITVVENKKEITELQKRLVNIFHNSKPHYIRAVISSPGGALETNVLYFQKQNYWAVFEEIENRYWNAFGAGKPTEGKNNSITCEINFPHEGINRKVAGAFGKENEEIVLLHRGKIGGGRRGIGKNLFWDNYRGEPILVSDGGVENTLALIGNLGSKILLSQIADFVHQVDRIKNLQENSIEILPNIDEIEIPDFNSEFKEEGFGKRRYSRKDEIESVSNHGIVINALAELLKSKGFEVGNDRKRDLYTIKNKRIDRIFEAKTDLLNGSIYSAVGQVLIYSIEKGLEVNKKTLVLPEKLKVSTEKIISKLGLEILYYSLEEDVVTFKEIDIFLKEK